MADYNWYNPTTWDMQNNPAYRAGESYYDLTQGENAAPQAADPWALAKDIGPLYAKFINDKLKGFNSPTPNLTMPNNILNNFESISRKEDIPYPNTGAQFTTNQSPLPNMQQDYRRPPLNQTNYPQPNVPFQDFNFSEYQGPSQEEEGITATETLPQPSRLDTFLQRFGVPPMTQTTAADKLANKAYMQQQGIKRNQETGRMTSGDFAGMNAPGESAWGSPNFGEMAQNWTDKFGDVEYSQTVIGDMKRKKQARLKAQAIAYAQKLEADKAAAEAASKKQWQADYSSWRSPSGRDHPGTGGIGSPESKKGGAPGTSKGQGSWKGYLGGRVGYNRGGRVGILAAF